MPCAKLLTVYMPNCTSHWDNASLWFPLISIRPGRSRKGVSAPSNARTPWNKAWRDKKNDKFKGKNKWPPAHHLQFFVIWSPLGFLCGMYWHRREARDFVSGEPKNGGKMDNCFNKTNLTRNGSWISVFWSVWEEKYRLFPKKQRRRKLIEDNILLNCNKIWEGRNKHGFDTEKPSIFFVNGGSGRWY